MTTTTSEPKPRHLQKKKHSLTAKRGRLMEAFNAAATEGNNRKMTRICRELRRTNEFLDSLGRIEQEFHNGDEIPSHPLRYVVSSLFLHECFKHLTADQHEQLVFITGAEISGRFVLDQKFEFMHTKRNEVAVVGNMSSTHRLLIRLEQFGHRLLGHFHSHPGTGPDSTRPSGIDQDFQKRLESAGYPTVAAIFSRDGFIRFFRLDETVQIHIHGTGVENLGKNVYRLQNVSAS